MKRSVEIQRRTSGILILLTLLTGSCCVDRVVGGDDTGKRTTRFGRWNRASSMRERREYAGGVTLADGRVLVVSGHPLGGQSLSSAEVYDPETARWTTVGSLAEARNSGNQATLLEDGRVLLAGGHSQENVIGGTEIFDPESGTWTSAGRLQIPRDPVSVRLHDNRVLAAGGINWYVDDGQVSASCELFDPDTRQWTATAPLNAPRSNQRMALMNDGRVLAVGGYGPARTAVATCEIYDPVHQQWRQVADLPESRAWFAMVVLEDGRVIVAGGFAETPAGRRYLNSVLALDASGNRWVPLAPMRSPRAGFPLAFVSDHYVLAAGGVVGRWQETAATEVYDVRTGEWSEAAPMHTERRNHRAAMLPDGGVLIIGGSNSGGRQYLNSCEIFRPGHSDESAE